VTADVGQWTAALMVDAAIDNSGIVGCRQRWRTAMATEGDGDK